MFSIVFDGKYFYLQKFSIIFKGKGFRLKKFSIIFKGKDFRPQIFSIIFYGKHCRGATIKAESFLVILGLDLFSPFLFKDSGNCRIICNFVAVINK